MNAIQILEPRALVERALAKQEQSNRAIHPGEIKVILSGRQYMKYYAARHYGIQSLIDNDSGDRRDDADENGESTPTT